MSWSGLLSVQASADGTECLHARNGTRICFCTLSIPRQLQRGMSCAFGRHEPRSDLEQTLASGPAASDGLGALPHTPVLYDMDVVEAPWQVWRRIVSQTMALRPSPCRWESQTRMLHEKFVSWVPHSRRFVRVQEINVLPSEDRNSFISGGAVSHTRSQGRHIGCCHWLCGGAWCCLGRRNLGLNSSYGKGKGLVAWDGGSREATDDGSLQPGTGGA